MQYEVVSQNRWLFPDSLIVSQVHRAEMTLLRGQTGGFQVLVQGLEPGLPITWRVEGLSDICVQGYREIDVRVNRNTNNLHAGPLTTDCWEEIAANRVRKAPYRVFDALEPIQGIRVKRETEAFYFTLTPEHGARAGESHGALTIELGAEQIAISLDITIGRAVLPGETLFLTNWFSVPNMARDHHLDFGSDAHWRMVEAYARTMRGCHQNVFWVTWEQLRAQRTEAGPIFDFRAVKSLVERFLALGFTRIEWSPLITRPSWGEIPFQIRDITEEEDSRPVDCLSTPGRKYLTAFLRQFDAFLTENGWREISLVHICDEPKERCASDFRVLAGIYRKYLPGIKLIDAVEIFFIEDALDIYVPKNYYFQQNRNDFEDLRDDANTLWFYTCNMPGGRFLNRFLDNPLLHPRLLHWGNYRYRLAGYLHWGYNQIRDGQDPFEQTSGDPGLPAGDTHIIYPGTEGPLLSMRYMQMKAGVEDYELLHALARVDAPRADALCARCFRAFDDYEQDPDAFDRVHEELVAAAEEALAGSPLG